MAQRCPLTPAERERIARDKGCGRTLVEIADELGCAVATVRKWWRIARDHGRTALHTRRRGRAATGVLGRFNPLVRHQALQFKRANPRWGAARVLVELQREPSLHGLPLPSRSRLALLFKIECPECIARQRPKRPAPSQPPHPSAAHECWQLDMQEGMRLDDGSIATICTIRDPVGAAILTAQAFDVSSPGRYRKLRWQEIQQVIRSACTRWRTLPDALQTDNEVCLGGQPSDPAPSQLTLWLIGLGVQHQFIRPGQPTDQAQIERTHRTLDNFTGLRDGLADLPTLQQRLDAEREQYNTLFASRASDCGGRPPLLAHPELRQPRRPYQPEWERALFDEQRVYSYLAGIPLLRKVSKTGQIQLGGQSRSVGRAYAAQTVTVQCDPHTREWVVTTPDQIEVKRLAIRGLDVTSLTGMPDNPITDLPPIQLTLPLAA